MIDIAQHENTVEAGVEPNGQLVPLAGRFGTMSLGGKSLDSLSEMSIDGKGISFFESSISECSSFTESRDGNWIQARFFAGSRFETICTLQFHETPAEAIEEKRSRFHKIMLCRLQGSSPQNFLENSSRLLRDSTTLKPKSFIALNRDDVGFYLDRGGVVFISSDANRDDQFKRIILIAMLAHAYARVLTDFTEMMARYIRNDNNGSEAVDLYESLLVFDAGFFSKNAVRLDRTELSKVWACLFDHLKLEEKRQELQEQLPSFSKWVEEKRRRREEALGQAEAVRAAERDRATVEARERQKELAEQQREIAEKHRNAFNLVATIGGLLAGWLAIPWNDVAGWIPY